MIKSRVHILEAFILASLLVMPLRAIAEEPAPAAGITTEMKSIEQARKTYGYKSVEARDPFIPLIKEMKEGAGETGKEPTEMYDIEIIKLVAVVVSDSGSYGLVRLPDGKHYSIRIGTPIGIHKGKIVEIQTDRVVIKQNVMNFRRELVEQTREIKLREEDEK